MFELNSDLEIKEEILMGSKIFIIDNFYKNPDEVYDFLFNREVPLWKIEQKPSFNTIHFIDKRLKKPITGVSLSSYSSSLLSIK